MMEPPKLPEQNRSETYSESTAPCSSDAESDPGVIVAPSPKTEPADRLAMLDVYRRELSLSRVARHFNMQTTSLTTWMRANGISDEDMARTAKLGRKERAFDDYTVLVERLGHHPTHTVLQRQYRALSGRIERGWGDITSFRSEFGIPAPPSGNPNLRNDVATWVAAQSRRAEERRTSLYGSILKCLTECGALSFIELRKRIRGGEMLVREVLLKALEDGLINRLRSRTRLLYRAVVSTSSRVIKALAPDLRLYRNRISPLSIKSAARQDPAARLIALERRRQGHAMLCDLLDSHARAVGMRCEDSDYIDLLVDGKIIIEVKTIRGDALSQTRAAVSQLTYYRFAYMDRLKSPLLIAAFSERPEIVVGDAVDYLRQCEIEVLWRVGDGFDGTDAAIEALRLNR